MNVRLEFWHLRVSLSIRACNGERHGVMFVFIILLMQAPVTVAPGPAWRGPFRGQTWW